MKHSEAFEKTFHKGQFENNGSAHIFVNVVITSITIFLNMRSEVHSM